MRIPPLALVLGLLVLPVFAFAQATFTQSTPFSVATNDTPQAIEIADLDGDGELDVVVAFSSNGAEIAWYDNDGGTWTKRTISTFTSVAFVHVADVNGDGNMDIVTSDYGVDDLLWFENDGTAENPGWTSHTIDAAYGDARVVRTGDIDGDGHLDIISSSRDDDDVDWWENDGTPSDGGWTEHEIDANTLNALDLMIVDVDGDGNVDVMVSENGSDQLIWFENDGTPLDGGWTERSIATSITGIRHGQAADIDGDGDIDAAVAATNLDDFFWFENTAGDGTTWTSHQLNASNYDLAWSTIITDIDDDGDNDVLGAADNTDDVLWYRNDDGTMDTVTEVTFSYAGDDGPRYLAAGDLDGDYDTDFVVSLTIGDDIALMTQDGAGTPPVTKPELVSVEIADSTWTLFGIPVDLNNASDGVPNTLFDDDMTVDYTDSTWVISRFEADSLDYIRFAASAQTNGLPAYMAPGYGFWIYHTETAPVAIDIDSSQFSGIPDAEVSLVGAMPPHDGTANGYGMFANPFDTTYTVGDMTFTSSDYSWAQVLDGGAQDQDLNANIYTYDGTQYVATSYTTATVAAWEGFWLVRTSGSAGSIDVNFPTSGVATMNARVGSPNGGMLGSSGQIASTQQDPVGQANRGMRGSDANGYAPVGSSNAGMLGTLASSGPAEGITGLRLMVSAHDGRVRDSYNVAGFRQQSRPGYDPHDAFEFSPPGTPKLQLYFLQDGTRFTNDLRGETVSSQVWDLDIRTLGLENETVTLRWETVGDLPSGTRWELSYRQDDPAHEDGARTPIGYTDELSELVFTVSDEFQSFTSLQLRLVAGDGGEGSADGPIPDAYGITRAYPNPFNSSLTVELTLPETRDVTLTVYDITGRRVATVARGPMTAGSHRLLWNADGVATGVYFVQAHSSLGSSVKKVSLVK